jgi:chemotaxis protein MotB
MLASMLVLAGCVAPGARESASPAPAGDSASAEQALKEERARVASLQHSLNEKTRELESNRAELNQLRERVASLTETNDKYRAILDERARQPLERPSVPASQLPGGVDEKLQAFAARYAGRVIYERGRGAVSFANDRLFESGSDVVRPDALTALRELAEILAATPSDQFEAIVVGHSDSAPITKSETLARHPSNWHLSVHRALAVKDVLVQAGLPAARLGVMGYADQRPVGADPARNRRVEVFLVRQGEIQPLAPIRAK